MAKVNSDITWNGWHFWLLVALLFIQLLKIKSRQAMNKKTDTGILVYQLLMEYGFNYKAAQMITAQAAHETGNFSSVIFKENNNLFGMKYAGQKIVKGEKYGHAVYNSLEESIQDYANYYRIRKYNSVYDSVESFVEALKSKGYFEAPIQQYISGVNHFMKIYFT